MSQSERPDDIGKILLLASNNQSMQVYSKVQDSPTADHPLLRNYSTYLFKLQSELQEVRVKRAKDAESNARIVNEIQCLYARIAELKGIIASLTIELHMLKDAVPKAPDATPPKKCNACSKNKELKKLKKEFRTVMTEKRKRKMQEKQQKQKNEENTEQNKVNKEKKKKNKGNKMKNNLSSDKQ